MSLSAKKGAVTGTAPEKFSGTGDETVRRPERKVIYEPDGETLIGTLVDMAFQNAVHTALLEARTGEHSARMTAMTAAADNTEELINELTLQLNHARQAAITTEISEIAGGAEALRQNSTDRS